MQRRFTDTFAGTNEKNNLYQELLVVKVWHATNWFTRENSYFHV